MMFNGLFVCGDSDTSDLTKSSHQPLSLAESSASDFTHAYALQTKLNATTQILKNKEETVRVQAESLALAEERIADLTQRIKNDALRKQSINNNEYHQEMVRMIRRMEKGPARASRNVSGRLTRTNDGAVACELRIDDVSPDAELQELDNEMVTTLRDNLSVIEEVYRECFYETAKQEEMMEKLRKSYTDMRLMDKQKADKICRLEHALRSQKWTLQKRQDVAGEVGQLGTEAGQLMTSSNDDSVQTRAGVWGGAEEEVAGGLRLIADQLARLRDALANDSCICGLEEENSQLKNNNEDLEVQMYQLQQRVGELETSLEDKENLDRNYQKLIKEKEEELQVIRQRLCGLQQGGVVECARCDALAAQLQRSQGLLDEKTKELIKAQEECHNRDTAIEQLRGDLERANVVAEENSVVREEVRQLAAQVGHWRRQLANSGQRVQTLQTALEAAKDECARLAAHCREQDDKIKQQESLIRSLQDRRRSHSERVGADEACCSYVGARTSGRSCRVSEMDRCSQCPSMQYFRTSESEITCSPTPPVPPRRLSRKKSICGDQHCTCALSSDAVGGQEVPPQGSHLCHSTTWPSCQRTTSPTAEILERVERAHEVLKSAQRRWGRRAPSLRVFETKPI